MTSLTCWRVQLVHHTLEPSHSACPPDPLQTHPRPCQPLQKSHTPSRLLHNTHTSHPPPPPTIFTLTAERLLLLHVLPEVRGKQLLISLSLWVITVRVLIVPVRYGRFCLRSGHVQWEQVCVCVCVCVCVSECVCVCGLCMRLDCLCACVYI